MHRACITLYPDEAPMWERVVRCWWRPVKMWRSRVVVIEAMKMKNELKSP